MNQPPLYVVKSTNQIRLERQEMDEQIEQRGFITPLRVENVDALNWVLTDDLVWVGTKGDTFVVNIGETTDFATVPWWTQALIPRTGTWTKAAVLHDKMCNQLNKYEELLAEYDEYVSAGISTQNLLVPIEPVFSSIDTDNIFRKNARDEGTDVVRAELLWLGVRYGALKNPARRDKWIDTAPRVVLDTAAVLGVAGAVITLVSKLWPW